MPSSRHFVRLTAASVAVAAVLSGCTIGSPSRSATPLPSEPVPTDTLAPEPTEAPTDSASPDPSATLSDSASPDPSATPTDSAGPDATPQPSGAPGTPGLISVDAGQQTQLTMANAFRSDGWTEGSYQTPGATAPVQALGAVVNCNQGTAELEYRFSTSRGQAKVTVAQDALSDSSDNTLEFLLVADGKQVASKTVTFKQTAELAASVNGVTALKVVARTKGACTNSSTALITKAFIQG